ncbi:hypothetical protein BD779DRAFT_1539265 [Infundibulicybe gibba]|nr:hypothetical protein BD779DRAFT_1539265 [Infundibulicybe gibba]
MASQKQHSYGSPQTDSWQSETYTISFADRATIFYPLSLPRVGDEGYKHQVLVKDLAESTCDALEKNNRSTIVEYRGTRLFSVNISGEFRLGGPSTALIELTSRYLVFTRAKIMPANELEQLCVWEPQHPPNLHGNPFHDPRFLSPHDYRGPSHDSDGERSSRKPRNRPHSPYDRIKPLPGHESDDDQSYSSLPQQSGSREFHSHPHLPYDSHPYSDSNGESTSRLRSSSGQSRRNDPPPSSSILDRDQALMDHLKGTGRSAWSDVQGMAKNSISQRRMKVISNGLLELYQFLRVIMEEPTWSDRACATKWLEIARKINLKPTQCPLIKLHKFFKLPDKGDDEAWNRSYSGYTLVPT